MVINRFLFLKIEIIIWVMFCFIVLDFLLFEIKEMYSNIIMYFEFIIRYCDILLKN